MPDPSIDDLRRYAVEDDPRNPGATASAVLWLAAEVRALRTGERSNMSADAQPCGSWRITREYQGTAAEMSWCSRTCGPCPFPNTKPYDDHDSPYWTCAELGGSRPEPRSADGRDCA